MRRKHSIGLGTVVLSWILAAAWVVRCIVDLTKGRLQGLDPIIAVLWCLIAVKWTKRYLEEKKDGQDDVI